MIIISVPMIKHKRLSQPGNVKVSLGEDQFASWDTPSATEIGAWKWKETIRCDSGNIVYRKEGRFIINRDCISLTSDKLPL